MLSTAARMVQWFTSRLVREYPTLDSEEVQGEFWLAAARSMRFWKQGGGEAFSTALFQDLRWERSKIIRRWVKDIRVASIRLSEEVMDPIEPGAEDRWRCLIGKLREDEQQILELMVNPSPVFLRYVKQCWQERRLRYQSTGDKFTVQQVHYAHFLGMSPMRVTRTIRRIQRVAQEVFYDER